MEQKALAYNHKIVIASRLLFNCFMESYTQHKAFAQAKGTNKGDYSLRSMSTNGEYAYIRTSSAWQSTPMQMGPKKLARKSLPLASCTKWEIVKLVCFRH